MKACTYNALDPKQLFFEGEILNPDSFPKEVDHSFHRYFLYIK